MVYTLLKLEKKVNAVLCQEDRIKNALTATINHWEFEHFRLEVTAVQGMLVYGVHLHILNLRAGSWELIG